MSTNPSAQAGPTGAPIVTSVPKQTLWTVACTMLALIAWYFIGLDQGAVSIFGADGHIHEFVHDARHFLGFPCH